MVQWLVSCASTAGDTGSIPGRGTRIPHASQCGKKKKKRFEESQRGEEHIFIPELPAPTSLLLKRMATFFCSKKTSLQTQTSFEPKLILLKISRSAMEI